MKITIEAEPKEISELLLAITNSEEQKIEIDGSKIKDFVRQDRLNNLRRSGVSEDHG